MNKIVSINKGNFLGTYIEAQNNQLIPDEVFFVAGAILTVGLPELFFSIAGGFIPFLLFASSLLVGTGLGLANYYYRLPYQTLSLGKGIVPQAPPGKQDTTKKAA